MILTRQKIRILLLGLIMAISLGVGITIFTHQRVEDEEEIVGDIAIEADAALEHFTYTQMDAGEAKWEIEAERGTHDAKRNITNLEVIRARFFGAAPNKSLTLIADKAQANLDRETVVAQGNVVVTTASGYRLHTPLLEYTGLTKDGGDEQTNQGESGVIHTAEDVDFVADKIRLQGRGMTYKIASRYLTIHNDVKAQIFPFEDAGDSLDTSGGGQAGQQ